MLGKKLKWYPVFSSKEEFEEKFGVNSSFVKRTIYGEFLFVRDRSEYCAFKNRCPHQNQPLDNCSIKEGELICPFHQYKFSLKNGRGHGLYIHKYELKFDEQVWIGIEKWSLF